MRILLPSGKSIGSDRLVSSILRTDATPVFASLEFQCILDSELDAELQEKSKIIVGDNYFDLTIIKRVVNPSSFVKDGNQVIVGAYIAVASGCENLIEPSIKAIYLENTSFAEIFRACGCSVSVVEDVSVERFFCPIGAIPTYHLARKMCEEATFPFLRDGQKLAFRRISNINNFEVDFAINESEISWIKNYLEEKNTIPIYQTLNADGSTIEGELQRGKKVKFYPNLDARKTQNLSTVLLVRGTIIRGYAPSLNFGHITELSDGKKYMVLTSAHRYDTGILGGASVTATKLWIAEVVKA